MLSHAQAMEVAKRFNPRAGSTLWFDDDGSLLARDGEHLAVAVLRGEVYACRRESPGEPVEVARVLADELGGLHSEEELAFGVPW